MQAIETHICVLFGGFFSLNVESMIMELYANRKADKIAVMFVNREE